MTLWGIEFPKEKLSTRIIETLTMLLLVAVIYLLAAIGWTL